MQCYKLCPDIDPDTNEMKSAHHRRPDPLSARTVVPRQEIDRGIGGPEWGTFLGPGHVEKLSLETLRSSGAFTQVRALSGGGAYLQLSDDSIDATTDKIVDLVAKAGSALEPILLDVSAVKL